MKESQAKFYFKQLTTGIQFLKQNLVLHRDLKPGNLFLTDNNTIKIGDFGWAAQLKSIRDRRNTVLGTVNYIAPEVWNKKEYSFSWDIWSLGWVLYVMLTGRPPFESGYSKQTLRRIMKEQYTIPKYVSEEAQDLLSKILKVDVEERLTIEDILKHPFLKDNEIENLEKKLESGNLITLGHPEDEINMFLNTEIPVENSKIQDPKILENDNLDQELEKDESETKNIQNQELNQYWESIESIDYVPQKQEKESKI